jgi:hypothetical protein
MLDFPERHAISRARFFLEQAERCSSAEQEAFECYLEASIIFGRTAILRLKTQHEKHPDWKPWFKLLKSNPTICFFWNYRNFIIHKGPPKVGQIITFNPRDRATELYYFDDLQTPATETVRQHLDVLAGIIARAETKFSS